MENFLYLLFEKQTVVFDHQKLFHRSTNRKFHEKELNHIDNENDSNKLKNSETTEELLKLKIPDTRIISAAIEPSDSTCRVTAIVTHPPFNDKVKVNLALPLKNWNGRYMGLGGGGFSAGTPLPPKVTHSAPKAPEIFWLFFCLKMAESGLKN